MLRGASQLAAAPSPRGGGGGSGGQLVAELGIALGSGIGWLVHLVTGFPISLPWWSFAIGLGFASMVIVAMYPFAKRVTFWPQAILGLAFSWGALMGWAAFTGELGLAPAVLLRHVLGVHGRRAEERRHRVPRRWCAGSP